QEDDLDSPIFNNRFNTIAKYFDLGVFDYRERMIEIRDGHLRTIITKAYTEEGVLVTADIEGLLPEAVYGQLCHQRRHLAD
ncbi:hypothetical protein IH781_03715, partial [Patescibacteria group bacterium]|nr:hypothetical protein [Patescibacteria group bacterium]